MTGDQHHKTRPVKVLVVQLGRIGDTTLSTPVFHAIKTNFPQAKIYVLVTRHGYPVLKENPYIHRILVHRKQPVSLLYIIFYLLFCKFDWWIDPKDHYSGEGSAFARLSRAKHKVGYNRPGKKVFTLEVDSNAENFHCHAVERYLKSLIPMGIKADVHCRPELFPVPSLEKEMVSRYIHPGKRNLLVNISAGSIYRLWPIENWSSIIKLCLQKGYYILLNFKPSDKDMAMFLKNENPEIVLVFTDSICQIIALMPHVDLVLTPDTSIVHIASAFNKPQIALYSDLDFNINNFKPLSENSLMVISKDGDNFHGISKDDVSQAIEKMELILGT